MKVKTLFIIFISYMLFACSSSNQEEINKVSWLLGTWQHKTKKGIIYESWSQLNQYELSGMSFFFEGQDTIVLETIQLIQENDRLLYIPIVQNQNDALPVRFVSTSVAEKEMVFENKNHDFPQVIAYVRITEDSLMASISGIVDGKERRQTFPMKREFE